MILGGHRRAGSKAFLQAREKGAVPSTSLALWYGVINGVVFTLATVVTIAVLVLWLG